MKKLFALISLLGLGLGLGLVAGMGGTLNAQEASEDTQGKLDTIILYGHRDAFNKERLPKIKFSATPGEKFVINWNCDLIMDTILVKDENEIEVSPSEGFPHFMCYIYLYALNPSGHITDIRIDSSYSQLELRNCSLVDTINVAHNNLISFRIVNCPAVKYIDISHNKLEALYFGDVSNVTYLDCSHNDILGIVEEGFTSLETLDCSYNHRLRQLRLSDCEALVNLTAIHNDSIRDYAFDLPQNSPLQSLTLGYTHLLQVLNLSKCPNLTTLNCYGNSQLTCINLSNNPKLETFNCFNCEQLTYLYINHTSWDSLDLSSMPTLESLDCSHNRLSYINLDNSKNLTQLFCNHNQLSYIDLSDCKNLINVDCRNNRFTTLDIPEDMILNSLNCDSNHIPLSVLANLSRHAETDWYEIRQFPTIAPMQVGDLLDLSGETDLNEYEEQYTLFFNGQQIEERFNDGLTDDYGLFTFDKAGSYRLHLKCTLNEGNYAIMSAYYDLTVVDSVVRPQFSIPSGAVLPDTALVLSTPTPNARIYYTTDGAAPDGNSLLYQEPIRITAAMTVKAIAIQDTFKSHIATATYTMDTVARPTFSIPSGTVKIGTTVSLSTTTPDARIIYTTDGGEPDNNALEYTEPIRINETMTIKAVAIYKTVQSQVATATYTMDTVARPTFSIPSGTVKIGTTVSLSTTTPDARIIYTTDGTEPGNNALEYTEPIRITEAMTIKAVAIYKAVKSQVATATYTIDSVANEHDLKASNLRVYAKDRTIYLSEAVGEVEVFSTGGICVYRGHGTAIPVGKSGIYIVSAAGKRWKVAVE